MKSFAAVAFIFLLYSCQTVKIKNDTYRVSEENVELGAIGSAKSFEFHNDFESKATPRLNSKVQVSIDIMPFTSKLNKIYERKIQRDQSLQRLIFIDSAEIKPEFALIKITDTANFIEEINSEGNTSLFTLLADNRNLSTVSGVAIRLPENELQKIRAGDSFFLNSEKGRKNTIAVYNNGKQTSTIVLSANGVLGYKISNFCWAVNSAGKFYVADLVQLNQSCMGRTKSIISEKKKTDKLFDM